jgi:hypothetical protein
MKHVLSAQLQLHNIHSARQCTSSQGPAAPFNTGSPTQLLYQQLISPAWQPTAQPDQLPDPSQASRTDDRRAAAQSQPLLPVWLCSADAGHLPLPPTCALAARLLHVLELGRLLLLPLLLLLSTQPWLHLLASSPAVVPD